MTRLDHMRLVVRERRAALELFLLGRALRANRTNIDRAITRLVLTRIPDIPPEPGRTRRLDST
ncbi:hypothetical protein [Nocardia fluminea]|uniref:hypothetical protein n=1 Tax=Nocardia fluminea TaxID=134984 RepID=UPI00342BE9D2